MSEQHNNDDGSTNNIPVRTLHVGPIDDKEIDMNDHIKSYFDQFGAVNSVEIEQENGSSTSYALVEFKMVETAATVLSSNVLHRINGCDVQVKAAEPWEQPDQILNALDDDCLRAILLELDGMDLFNAANVCIRFNHQAKSVFSTKMKQLHLSQTNFNEAKILVQNFGAMAQSIDVKAIESQAPDLRSEFENKITSLIAQCCTSKLTELTLHNFRFEHAFPDNIEFDKSLSKLERLSLVGCDLSIHLVRMLSVCTELKVLHLDKSFVYFDLNGLPKYEKLEEIHLIKSSGFVGRFLNTLVAPDSTLKKLSLRISRSNTIRAIVQNLPKLLELGLTMKKKSTSDDFTDSIRYLAHLKSLKVLTFKLNGKAIEPLVLVLAVNAIPIERLRLIKGTIDADDVKAIVKMKKLKVLELCDVNGMIDEHLIDLAMGLGSRLENLRLEGSTAQNITKNAVKTMLPLAKKLSHFTMEPMNFNIHSQDYEIMLNAVRNRHERSSLSMELTAGKGRYVGQVGRITVPHEILCENRDVFYIEVKNTSVENDDNDQSNNSDDDFGFDIHRFRHLSLRRRSF